MKTRPFCEAEAVAFLQGIKSAAGPDTLRKVIEANPRHLTWQGSQVAAHSKRGGGQRKRGRGRGRGRRRG